MSKATKVYELLYNLSRAEEILGDMTPSELAEFRRLHKLEFDSERTVISHQLGLWNDLAFDISSPKELSILNRATRKRNGEKFEDFGLPKVMQRVKSLVMGRSSIEGISEIAWLLRILLISPRIFASIRELENFLTNITAIEHNTKSTGRDRIVDWYFKRINELPPHHRDELILAIARHLFISLPSNYTEWHALLMEDGN